MSFAELDERTGALAETLRARGVGRESVVGALLPRSIEQVVAFMAVMRAGAAYLPLDVDHPAARTGQIVSSARPDLMVTDDNHTDCLRHADCLRPATDGRPLRVVPGADHGRAPVQHSAPGPDTASAPAPRPEDPAYVIFTSGSTGDPKGVVVEHRAIVNRLLWMRETFAVGPGDRVLYKTPATFDVSVWELFLPPISGATLVVAPPGAHRDPGQLARIVRRHRITAMHFVPSMLGPFLDHPESRGLKVDRVFCSGESLSTAHRDRFHDRIDGSLHNLYGPTEAAVDVSHWPVPAHDRSDPIPIGKPVWNTRLYVLDDRLEPVPPGTPGHLHIAGRQLARGYLGRDDLTASVFVPDPFQPGERMYRTGDRARWSDDGSVVFLGRDDHQVKIRGQRVELGEIEAAIMSLPDVGSAVAVPREDSPGRPELIAFATPAASGATPETAIGVESIRTRIARLLPDAMVPGVVVLLDELPRTPSGKVDRAALPRPPRKAATGGDLRTDTERMVARLFRDILDLDGIPGPSDDFFALGGHSLSAIEVLAGVREAAQVDLGPGTLFSMPTVARFAAAVDRHRVGGGGASVTAGDDRGLGPAITLARGPDDMARGPDDMARGPNHMARSPDDMARGPTGSPPGFAPPIYCIHPAGGIAWCYTDLARTMGSTNSVVGLQSPGLLDANWRPGTLDDVASSYVDTVLGQHPGGPVHLVGWSVGGIIAHAMASRLVALRRPPGMVALLDAYPADCWRDQEDPEEGEVLEALLLIAGEDPATVAGPLTRAVVRERFVARSHVLGELSASDFDGVVRVVESNNRLVRSHRHRRLEGEVIHFRAGLDHEGQDLAAEMWRPYARNVEAHVVPSLHAHMTGRASSARIATVLRRRLQGEVRA